MPVARFQPGNQSSSGDLVPRSIIPGIEPGGSRVGHPTKPALLIKDAWFQVQQLTPGSNDYEEVNVWLKLSQEHDLSPGLLLPVGALMSYSEAVSGSGVALQVDQRGDKIAGTIWAPRVVGMRLDGGAFPSNVTIDVWLSYEQVNILWEDWFFRWDFLDNVVDNRSEW